jgi:hypothetical protein
MECSGGVVISSPRDVAEGIVGVVYLLKSFCSSWAVGGVGGHAVWVVFEGLTLVGFADLNLSCARADFEDFVVVDWGRGGYQRRQYLNKYQRLNVGCTYWPCQSCPKRLEDCQGGVSGEQC